MAAATTTRPAETRRLRILRPPLCRAYCSGAITESVQQVGRRVSGYSRTDQRILKRTGTVRLTSAPAIAGGGGGNGCDRLIISSASRSSAAEPELVTRRLD